MLAATAPANDLKKRAPATNLQTLGGRSATCPKIAGRSLELKSDAWLQSYSLVDVVTSVHYTRDFSH
jgi:hypothetical protein